MKHFFQTKKAKKTKKIKKIKKLKQKFFSYAVFFILAIFYNHVSAEDANFSQGFAQGLQTAAALQNKASTAVNELKPETFIKNYSSEPQEAKYQNNPDAIKTNAIQAVSTDTTGKSIVEGMDKRKAQFDYPIDPASSSIQHIQQKANDVYDVITNQFHDCTKQTSCSSTYETKVCEEAPKSSHPYCYKTLNIDFTPRTVEVHHYLTAKLSVKDHSYAGVSVNAVTGAVDFLGPHDASFQLEGRLPNNLDCHSLVAKIVSTKSDNKDARLDYIHFPSCTNGLVLDFHISNSQSMELKIDIISSTIEYDAKDRWEDGCTGLASSASCTLQEEHCTSPTSTRTMNGISITRDCWEKQASYLCHASEELSTCGDFRSQGCEQVNSYCKNRTDGECSLYQQTFRCATKHCTDVGMICNGETYCLTGDCVKQQKQVDPDFQQSVTGLSVINAAAKNYGTNAGMQFPIFGGQIKTCNKDFLNFANCCSDTGWGVDLHLAQCDQEAKDLGVAKQQGLAVYVDSNEKCTLGVCSHKKRYCVFPSKLARILQEGGRRDQLHVSFGNYDHADCRGLTPEEFAELDLKKIDFSEIYADITKNKQIEDQSQVNERLRNKIQQWHVEKASHG